MLRARSGVTSRWSSMALSASAMAFGSPLEISEPNRLWQLAKPGIGSTPAACRFRFRLADGLGMRAEQRQQKRDFFLRTDLDHDCLLLDFLVGASGRGVQHDLVSAVFQSCFVGIEPPVHLTPAIQSAIRSMHALSVKVRNAAKRNEISAPCRRRGPVLPGASTLA